MTRNRDIWSAPLQPGRSISMNHAAIDLETFIRSELGSRCQRRIIGGPAIALDSRATTVLAPVLQEIVSETADPRKPAGEADALAVVWSCDHQGRCVIELIDSTMPGAFRSGRDREPCDARQRAGIEGSGNGMIRCEMSERGARIVIPARYVANRRASDQSNGRAGELGNPFRGRSVLVVEDQLLIALDLEALLLDQGASSVQLCGSAEEALRSIRLDRPDLAILDVNLGDTTSFPVAAELQGLGIPFIFATGYGNEVEFPSELRAVPLVAKPYCVRTILDALLSASVLHA